MLKLVEATASLSAPSPINGRINSAMLGYHKAINQIRHDILRPLPGFVHDLIECKCHANSVQRVRAFSTLRFA